MVNTNAFLTSMLAKAHLLQVLSSPKKVTGFILVALQWKNHVAIRSSNMGNTDSCK